MADSKKRYISNRISLLLVIVLGMLCLLNLLSDHVLKDITNLHKIFIYIVIFIIPIFVYLRVNRYKARTVLKLGHVKLKYAPFIVLFGLSVSIICALINMLMSAVFESVWDIHITTSAVGFVSDNPFVIALTLVIMPAVCEELLMRGVALTEYGKYGVSVSVIITSVLFALFHGSLFTLVSLFVAGVFYAVLTYLFKSVYPAIFCHIINNALAVYINYNSDYIKYLASDSVFLIALAIAVFIVLYITLRLTENVIDDLGDKKRLKTNTKKLAYGDPIASPYIWLFIVISIVVIVLNLF